MIGRKITDQTISCKVIRSIPSVSINPSTYIQNQTDSSNSLQIQTQPFHSQSLSNQPLLISGRIFGCSNQTIEAEIDFGVENYNCLNRIIDDYPNKQSPNPFLKQQRPGGSRNVTQYFISSKEKPINMESRKIVHSAKNITQTYGQIKNHKAPLLNGDHHRPKPIPQIKQMKEIKEVKQMKQMRSQLPITKAIINNSRIKNTNKKLEKSHNNKQSKMVGNRNICAKQLQKSNYKNTKSSTTTLLVTKQKQKVQQQQHSSQSEIKINHLISDQQLLGNSIEDKVVVVEDKLSIRGDPTISQGKSKNGNQQNNHKKTRQTQRYMSVKEEIELELKRRAECQTKNKLNVSKNQSNNLSLTKNTNYLYSNQQGKSCKQEEQEQVIEQDEGQQKLVNNKEQQQSDEQMEQQERRVIPEPIQVATIRQKANINIDNEYDKQYQSTNGLLMFENGQQQYITGVESYNYLESSSDQQLRHQCRSEQDEQYEDYPHSLQGEQEKDQTINNQASSQPIHESSFCEQECDTYSVYSKVIVTKCDRNQNDYIQQSSKQQQEKNQQEWQSSEQQESQQDNPRLTEYLRQRNLISPNSSKYALTINQYKNNTTNSKIIMNNHEQKINQLLGMNNFSHREVIVQLDEEYMQSSVTLEHSNSSHLIIHNHQYSNHKSFHNQQSQQQKQQYLQSSANISENYYSQFPSSTISSDSQQLNHSIINYPPSVITPDSTHQQHSPVSKDTTPFSSLLTDSQLNQLFTLNIHSLLTKDFINLNQ